MSVSHACTIDLSMLLPTSFPYNLVVASVFQNEAPFFKEWIEFHKMMGVELFILINDRSTDDFALVLQPYIDAGEVALIDRPCPKRWRRTRWVNYQRSTLHDVCARMRGVARWLALIDVDEFIVPAGSRGLLDFLARHEERFGGIYIRWVPFGTANVKRLPTHRLMTEVLCRKRRFLKAQETLGKSIVQPLHVVDVDVHLCMLAPDHEYLDCNPGMRHRYPPVKLHHYWSRSEEYLLKEKLPRVARIKGWPTDPDSVAGYRHLFNDVPDHTMKRFAPELRRRVFANGADVLPDVRCSR